MKFALFCLWAAPCILLGVAVVHVLVMYACWQVNRLFDWLDGSKHDKHPWDGNTT